MDDYRIYFYIILGILWFLFKSRGKNKTPAKSKPAPVNTAPIPQRPQQPVVKDEPKALDIEELLKNVMEQQTEQPNLRETFTEKREESVLDYDDEKDVEPPIEAVVEEDEEEMDRYDAYDIIDKKSRASVIRKKFLSQDDVREAFIMSEILQKKY